MRAVQPTSRYKRDYKRESRGAHRHSLDVNLDPVIIALATDQALPAKFQDHALMGNWRHHRECHIKPDLLLIYSKPNADTLVLDRLGSHAELGLG